MGCVYSSTRFCVKRDDKMAEGGENAPGGYICDICGQEGLPEAEMRSHVMIQHVEGQISCPFCDLEGTTAEEMTLHVNAAHLESLTPTKHGVSIADVTIETVDSSNDSSGSNHTHSSTVSSGTVMSNNTLLVESSNSSSASDTSNNGFPLPSEELVLKVYQTNSANVTPTKTQTDASDASRKRASLFLDVPRQTFGNLRKSPKVNHNTPEVNNIEHPVDVTVSDVDNRTSPDGHYPCPFCFFTATSSHGIEQHVNIQHEDILRSPGEAIKDSENNTIIPVLTRNNQDNAFECPLCGKHMESCDLLQSHVDSEHADILSPDSSQTECGTPMSVDSGAESPQNSCPVCGMECSDADSLTLHVEGHFSSEHTPVLESVDTLLAQELHKKEMATQKFKEQKDFEKLQDRYGMRGKNNYKRQTERNLERAVYNGEMNIVDYYDRKIDIQHSNILGVDDGLSCTKGLIVKLKQYYKTCIQNVSVHWLCSPTDHYASSYGDKGWGCGYRNFQMLLSSLATHATYEKALFNGKAVVPSIPKIQRLIEAAWQKGFDLQGREQLGGKVVSTCKWIGATDIVATLSSLRVKCQLLDFHAPSGKGGTHPRLFEWVRNYFRREAAFRPPLFLQHQGHSRTIIGMEELKDGSLRLLLFDPSCSRKQMQQFISGPISSNLMRTLRRPLAGLRAKQYQIVSVVGLLSDKEYEESKQLKSERIT